MDTAEQQRHRMIGRAVLRRPDAQADASIWLWKSLATELSLIIGKRGFESLYARSLSRAGAEYAWLRALPALPAQAGGDAFERLGANLLTREAGEAHAASAALLCTFTDILIVLIGELLTISILRKAWGDDVVDNAETEHPT
ncbi:MAG: hypothetical protein H7335_17570 [Massilia sp.]|nr:hypothetical protein [Massilia sp.]